MALTSRGVDSGTGINVLVDPGATGDMQVMKLAIGPTTDQTLIPGDGTNGLKVQSGDGGINTLGAKADPGNTATDTTSLSIVQILKGIGIRLASLVTQTSVGASALLKAEDAAAASGDAGVMALAVRRDTAVSDGAAGDYTPLHVDATGGLRISGSQIEDAAAASGDRGVFALAVRRDTPTSGAAAGDYHEIEVDALGRLWITGTQAEDAVAASGDTGHFILAVRRDAPTSGAAAGDYHELEVDALGRLWVSGTFAEDAAHVSGDYGNFVLGVQSLTRTSRSADGDYTPFAVDAAGAQFVATVPEANSAWALSNVAAHAAASGVIKASAGKLYHVTITSDNAAMQYVMFFNTTAVPADATAPLFAVCVPSKTTIQLDFTTLGKIFTTGICWSNSTTFATKTIGNTDCSVEATFL